MAHKASASTLVTKIEDLWGPIHELGHNQQRSCWEFPSHTTECTCNLWSVYVHEEVLGINRAKVEYSSLFSIRCIVTNSLLLDVDVDVEVLDMHCFTAAPFPLVQFRLIQL